MVRRSTKIILILVALVAVGVLAGGGFWIYKRGLTRENLAQRAERALREERYDAAIDLARQALAAEPGLEPAFNIMMESYIDTGRLDEARAVATEQLENPKLRDAASAALCAIALHQNRLDEAERVARSFLAQRPGHAYRVLSLIEDLRGLGANDWRRRLEAASIRRGLVAVSESDADKAEALLFSAQLRLEVAPFLRNAEGLVTRAHDDLARAVEAASRARQQDTAYPYDLIVAMIGVLSRSDEEAEGAARTLRKYLTGLERSEQAVAELAKWHIRRGEKTEAVTLIRELKDSYLWLRLFWILRQGSHVDVALDVLDTGPIQEPREVAILRGELLLQSDDEAKRTEGRELLLKTAHDAESTTPQVLRSLLHLAERTDLDTAREAASAPSVQERQDRRLTAFLASLLSASEEDKERGLEMARELARGVETPQEENELMGMLSGAGGGAMGGYLDAQVERGGEAGTQARLQRAVARLAQSRAGNGEEASQLRDRVLEDLHVLLADASASKSALIVAFNLAAGLEKIELAGRFVGRAVVLDGEPEMLDARILELVRSLGNEEVAKGLAAGVRASAEGSDVGDYLRHLADGIETGVTDRTAYRLRLVEIAESEPAARTLALGLASRIAVGEGDLVEAEKLARIVLEADPADPSALETLSACLLKRGDNEGVLALYEGKEKIAEIGHCHIVGALVAAGRRDEALARARDLVQTYSSSALMHVLLARVYLERGDRQAALGVLNVAPSNAYVLYMRAELLREFGDNALAEQAYEVLLLNSGFRDVRAWQGLWSVLSQGKRETEFIEKSGVVIKAGQLEGRQDVLAIVHCLRGLALEREGRAEEALLEYEEAIRIDESSWMALNNAAWLIATTAPARAAEARVFIDRARASRPDDPSLLDTAAEVYAILGEGDRALELIDEALALKPEGKMARYTVHRGRILLRMGRDDDARACFETVLSKYDDPAASKEAQDRIWEIERKNLPDRPEEEIVLPPEEEEGDDVPEDGSSG